MKEPLDITLFVTSYEDLERQHAELFAKTGRVVSQAVMPLDPGDFPPGCEVSWVQMNSSFGPVRVELRRKALPPF